MSRQKICILGTGDISHEFIKQVLTIEKNISLGVYHRERLKAIKFAQLYELNHVYSTIKEVCESDMSVVYNALPNSLHYQTSVELLKSKKHVIVEKPITSNLKELQHLVKLANDNHVMIIEVNRVQYNEGYQFIKHQISTISPVRLIHINYCKVSRKYVQFKSGIPMNTFSLEYSGGALYDLGVYGLQFVVGLLGMPDYADYKCIKLEGGVDGCGTVTLSYKQQVVSIVISKITNGRKGIEIQGESGTIISDFPPSILSCVYVKGINEENEIKFSHEQNPFKSFIENALNIIQNNQTKQYHQLVQYSDNTMRLLEELRRSADIVFNCDNRNGELKI